MQRRIIYDLTEDESQEVIFNPVKTKTGTYQLECWFGETHLGYLDVEIGDAGLGITAGNCCIGDNLLAVLQRAADFMATRKGKLIDKDVLLFDAE